MRVRRAIYMAVSAVLAASLTACGGESLGQDDGPTSAPAATEASDGTEAPPSDMDPIRIGVLTPLTGPSSDPGQRASEGAEVAAELINESGGVDGRQVELVVRDDKSTPEEGVLKLQELRASGISFFTGTVNSTVAIAIGNFVQDTDEVYVITAAQAQSPLDDQKNGNVFAMSNTNAKYGEVYLPWISENLAPKTVAVLAETSDYGNNELASLAATWSGPEDPQIISERFDREQSDYSSQLTTLISQNPDALYAVAGGTELPAKILRQAADLGFEGQGLSGPGTISAAFLEAGGSAVEGVISANVYATNLDNEVNLAFVDRFEEKFGRSPSAEAALGYDGVSIIVSAIIEAGSDDPADVAAAMAANTWPTTRGELGFDETGRLINETLIVRVQDGNVVIVD